MVKFLFLKSSGGAEFSEDFENISGYKRFRNEDSGVKDQWGGESKSRSERQERISPTKKAFH